MHTTNVKTKLAIGAQIEYRKRDVQVNPSLYKLNSTDGYALDTLIESLSSEKKHIAEQFYNLY